MRLIEHLISNAIIGPNSITSQYLLTNWLESPDNWLIYNYFIVYIVDKVKVLKRLNQCFYQFIYRFRAMLKNVLE